jgi:hypothetical protein
MLSIKKWSLQIVECPIVEMQFYFSGGAIEADNKGVARTKALNIVPSTGQPGFLCLAFLPMARPRIAPGLFCPSDVSGLIPSCRLGLRPFLDWARRQLQYRSPLPRSEVGDKNDCTVREFESVVMLVWLVEVNLAKAR